MTDEQKHTVLKCIKDRLIDLEGDAARDGGYKDDEHDVLSESELLNCNRIAKEATFIK